MLKNVQRQSALHLPQIVGSEYWTINKGETNILEVKTLQSIGVSLVCDSRYIP